MKLDIVALLYLIAMHIVALSGFLLPIRPVYVLVALLVYVAIGLGTTVGLHRLICHRSFVCPRWVEYTLVSVAMVTGQGSPLLWAANHRAHHRYSDGVDDVHSPHRGFWYSHVGWIIDKSSTDPEGYRRYCKDIANDRYYQWLIHHRLAPHAIAVLLIAMVMGWETVPFVFYLPAVCWMHATYSVNSVCHLPLFGSRRFPTSDRSRNVWWVGILAFGEGWHNNHHACPRAARHGHAWYQVDFSYWFIRLLAALGLAWNLKGVKS
jgi:fatty-acid desaturase